MGSLLRRRHELTEPLVWLASTLALWSIGCGGGGGGPCGADPDSCSMAGETTCVADAVHTCEANADGCLVWTLTRTCGGGATCDDSGSVAVCVGGEDCGNDTIDGTEVCDGMDLDGETCGSLGFDDGTLACSDACDAFDTSGCVTTTYAIQDCRLEYPATVSVEVDEAFTGYVRVHAPGLTDISGENDPAAQLVVELGYGLDGTDPSMGTGGSWMWLETAVNAGYGPSAPGYDPVFDEYGGDVVVDGAGIYDLAGRASGDGGTTWSYCDLDGLATGGYTVPQAGHLEVGQ